MACEQRPQDCTPKTRKGWSANGPISAGRPRADRHDAGRGKVWDLQMPLPYYVLDSRAGLLENEVDEFTIVQDEMRNVEFVLDSLPFNKGTYLLSFSVYDLSFATTRHGADVRYDVLAHALTVNVMDDETSGKYLVEHRSEWEVLPPDAPQV